MINKKYLPKIALPVVALFVAANMVSCSEDEPVIGADLLKKDKIQVLFNDESTINSFTLTQQDAYTSGVGLGLLGNLNDENFGSSRAGFTAQLRMPKAASFLEHENATTDSIKLVLAYYDIVGDTKLTQTVRVSELTGDLDPKKSYKGDFDITPLLGNELGHEDFDYESVIDSSYTVNDAGEKENIVLQKKLIVSLPVEFGDKFLNADKENMVNQEAFLQFFKGVYVDVDPLTVDGAVFSFNLLGSYMRLYYKNNDEDDEKNEGREYDFRISENSARINLFHHNREGAKITKFLDNTSQEDTVTYVQGMTGTKVLVNIGEINTKFNNLGKIAVNRAELEIFVADTLDVPERLMLKAINEDDEEIELPDNSISPVLLGGFYDHESESYRFNFSYYLQEIIDGKTTNNGFVIFSANGEVDPRRVILYNKKDEGFEKRIKFSVTYTNL